MSSRFRLRFLDTLKRHIFGRSTPRKRQRQVFRPYRLGLEPLEDRMLLSVQSTLTRVGDFVVADLNKDGISDMVAIDKDAVDAAVLIGRGDGTFDRVSYLEIGRNPEQIVAAHFNGDDAIDLAIVDVVNESAHILLGRGDGTFLTPFTFGLVDGPTTLLNGDFDGDLKQDIVYWSEQENDKDLPAQFWVMFGNGDGSFKAEKAVGRAQGVKDAVAADLDGDGFTDVAYVRNQQNPHERTSNSSRPDGGGQKGEKEKGQIGLFYGSSNRALRAATKTIEDQPASIAAGDVNNDGRVDLVSNDLRHLVVLVAKEGRAYEPERYAPGVFPLGFVRVVADVTGDGLVDVIATPFARSTQISLFPGLGDGRFAPAQIVGVGNQPLDVAKGTFNNDRLPDLAVVFKNGGVAALMGRPEGIFVTPSRYKVEAMPAAMVTGDFDRDGRNDIATANHDSNNISIMLGHGDGHFTVLDTTIAVGTRPRHLIAADFNNDGRLDLATADANGVSILYGLGDGTFWNAKKLAAGVRPTFLATADFNGDGYADLAVASPSAQRRPGSITVFVGSANGEFRLAQVFAVGRKPSALVTADFNRDGRIDIASANRGSNDISIVAGNGDGSFGAPVQWAIDGSPIGLVLGDYDGDKILDLITVGTKPRGRSIPRLITLLGDGNGVFTVASRRLMVVNPFYEPTTRVPRLIAVSDPRFLQGGDFDSDGKLDLIVTEPSRENIYLNVSRGPWNSAQSESVAIPTALIVGQFDADGLPDMAIANRNNEIALFDGSGTGRFTALHMEFSPIKPSPWFVDLTKDGVRDLLSFDRVGNLLFRAGQSGKSAVFDPPILVSSGTRVRDLTSIQGLNGAVRVAALNVAGTKVLIYEPRVGGPKNVLELSLTGLGTEVRATQIESADFNADGLSDLVLLQSGPTSSVSVYFANRSGSFDKNAHDFEVDFGTTDLYAANIIRNSKTGDEWIDIVLVNQLSGLCTVMFNTERGKNFEFGKPVWMGYGLAGRTEARKTLYGVTPDNTMGLAITDLDRNGRVEMIAVNSGVKELTIVQKKRTRWGGYEAPRRVPIQTYPGSIKVARLNRDGFDDLVLLDQDRLEVLLGDGEGNFRSLPVIQLQTGLSGLSVVSNVPGTPGRAAVSDLVISNAQGDVVTLLGNGDGTFETPQSAALSTDNISLAVATRKNGEVEYIVTDPRNDRVTITCAQSGECLAKDVITGVDQPTAVSVADVDADGRLDLVVGDGGANSILVYLGTADGKFGDEQKFGVGTRPVDVTLNDIDKNGLLDLVVANEGSNDVSILLGQRPGGRWTLSPGPRLKADAGPVATVVDDVTGPNGTKDGIPDVLVANGAANTIFQFRGLGNGFFSDQQPQSIPLGDSPFKFFVTENPDGTSNVTSVNRGSVTFVPALDPSKAFSVSTGEFNPTSAVFEDVDSDNRDDLVVAYEDQSQLGFFRGAGGFANFERIASGLLEVSALVISPFGGLFAADGNGAVSAIVLPLKSLILTDSGIGDTTPATPVLLFALVPGLRENEGIELNVSSSRADADLGFEQEPLEEAGSKTGESPPSTNTAGGDEDTIEDRQPDEWSPLHKRNRHMFGIRDAEPKSPADSEKTPPPETPVERESQPRSELPKESIDEIVPVAVLLQGTDDANPVEDIPAAISVQEAAVPVETVEASDERTSTRGGFGILFSLVALNHYAGTFLRRKKTASPHIRGAAKPCTTLAK